MGGAARAFHDILTPYLPAAWLQINEKHMELLLALGMQQNLTCPMILLCSKHLHTQTPESMDATGNDEALIDPADLTEDEDEDDEEEEEAPDIKPLVKTVPPPKKN